MNRKTDKISFRLSEAEKIKIALKAKKLGMDFSQYVRLKLLEEAEDMRSEEAERKAYKLFDLHQALMMRLIINNYLKTSAIAEDLLSKELIEEIKHESIKQHKLLGIEKTDN